MALDTSSTSVASVVVVVVVAVSFDDWCWSDEATVCFFGLWACGGGSVDLRAMCGALSSSVAASATMSGGTAGAAVGAVMVTGSFWSSS